MALRGGRCSESGCFWALLGIDQTEVYALGLVDVFVLRVSGAAPSRPL